MVLKISGLNENFDRFDFLCDERQLGSQSWPGRRVWKGKELILALMQSSDILPGDAGDTGWASLAPRTETALSDQHQSLQEQLDDLHLRLLESQTSHVAKLGQLRAQLAVRDDALRALQVELNEARDKTTSLESRALASSLAADAEISSLRDEIRLLRAEAKDAKSAAAPVTIDRDRRRDRDAVQERVSGAPTTIAALEAQLKVASSERDAACADLAKRDSELHGIQAHVAEQQSRIRALHEQLATFITREAADSARVEDATVRAADAEAELSKRKMQLNKVVKALTRVRERELAASNVASAQVRREQVNS